MLSACFTPETSQPSVSISAAASLTDVLQKISGVYTGETGIHVGLNLASSSVSARQIKEGKRSSLFISANRTWIDYLKGQYIEGSERVLLYNSLVVVVPLGSDVNVGKLSDLQNSSISGIALGDPSHVPAGIYAKESLEMNHLWDSLKEKVIGCIDVRAALALVENGAVDCAIVYKSDALFSDRVNTVFEIPAEKAPSVEYYICQMEPSEEADNFYAYLLGDEGQRIFKQYGFDS